MASVVDSKSSPAQSRSKKDSSLLARVLAGVLFVPCFILITLRGDFHYLFLMDLVIFTGLAEFYGLMSARGFRPARVVGIGCGLALSWYAYFRTGMYGNFLLALALLLLMTVELTRRSIDEAVTRIATTIFGVLYVGWLGSHFILLRELPRVLGLDYGLGAEFVFLVVLLTWSCDTGAYVVGRSLGRHALYPRVSPKKSREGALGGVLFSLIAAVIAQRTFAGDWLEPTTALILAFIAAIAGQTGDLVESLIKRGSQVKDSASIIPGHGGTLDRFDSLFFSAPLLYYALKFFVL
jgi:phosphatidate cytidylyltransferase